jgi:hypothetical protein
MRKSDRLLSIKAVLERFAVAIPFADAIATCLFNCRRLHADCQIAQSGVRSSAFTLMELCQHRFARACYRTVVQRTALVFIALPLVAIYSVMGNASEPTVSIDETALVSGKCESMIIAGNQQRCAGTVVMYTHLTNGRVLLTTDMPGNQKVAFVAESDSLTGSTYRAYLTRVRVEGANSLALTVSGTCSVALSGSGDIWARVDCDAIDDGMRQYQLRFRSDGGPILRIPARPGQ